MPPKKKSPVKKKKAKVEKEEPFAVPRDLSEPCPIDAHDGLLGLEHSDVKGRVRAVNLDIVLWKVSEAVRSGELDIDLADHGLDSLPDELFDLPWVQVLDLSKNLFVNEIFDDLPLLPSLKAVDLSTNLLLGPLPANIGSLPPTLEELCLDGNVITEVPEAAAALSQLAWFSVKKNMLTSIPASCLRAWTKLEYLDLRRNKLTVLPDEIGACVELRTLFLSENCLTALPETLGSCVELTLLHASRNSLKRLPDSMERLGALVELDVSYNKLESVGTDAMFAGMRSLVKLLAAANKIDAVPATLALASNLEVISLSANNIKSLPDELGALSRLREAYFNGNPLTALPATLAGWTALEEGSFKFCKLKALPGEVADSWRKVHALDLRSKKKDTCKVAPELKEALRKVHMLGAVITKAKKKAAAGKKKK